MPRLFTGIEIPAEKRAELARLRMPLPGGGRWAEPENFHLTLRFCGDIEKAQADELIDRLAGISMDAFEIRLSSIGSFGGRDPHAIWAGVEPSAELDALARANEKTARAVGLPPEPRAFKPHVTLARLKYASPDEVARILGRIGAYRSEPFFVGRFVLFSSRPKTGGGPYAVEETFPLRGGEFADLADIEGGW
jgi:RNA 2',3'-cyclic 3'-phosphodiesterase